MMDARAEQYNNSENIELAWAFKAHEQAEIHFNIITSLNPRWLKLSGQDDEIYKEFRSTFPNFNIKLIDEEEMKSAAAKKEWREYCNKFDKVQDFNYGTLLRKDPFLDYTEENTIFATRIQFLAIEIARNREGLTSILYNKHLNERRKNKENNAVDKATELLKESVIAS